MEDWLKYRQTHNYMFLYSGRYINTLEINERYYECLNVFRQALLRGLQLEYHVCQYCFKLF